MEEIKTAIYILISIAALFLTAHKYLFGLFSHAIKRYELYTQMRELCGNDATNNLAQLRVALDTITTKELSPKEIEWFIYTPNAFRYLKRYGRNARYVDIDFDTNKFCYALKVSSLKYRFAESLKILTIYTISGIIGVVLILNNELLSNVLGLIPPFVISLIGLFSSFLALGTLYISLLFQNSVDMVKSKIPE